MLWPDGFASFTTTLKHADDRIGVFFFYVIHWQTPKNMILLRPNHLINTMPKFEMPKQEAEEEQNKDAKKTAGYSVNARGEVEMHKDLGEYMKSVEEEKEAEK